MLKILMHILQKLEISNISLIFLSDLHAIITEMNEHRKCFTGLT